MKRILVKLRDDKAGAAMAVALLCILVLSVLGTALWQYFMADLNHTDRDEKGMQAYYVARAGADAVAQYIIKNPDNLDYAQTENFLNSINAIDSRPETFGNGEFIVNVTRDADKTIHIKSKGYIKNNNDIVRNVSLTLLPVGAPETPESNFFSAEDLHWLSGGSHVVFKGGSGSMNLPVVFDPGNDKLIMKLETQNKLDQVCNFSAPGFFFEGGVFTNNASRMTLTAGLDVFRGRFILNELQDGGSKIGPNQLVLHVNKEDAYDVSKIPEAAATGKTYGIVYFLDGVAVGDEKNNKSKIVSGAYLFPDGCTLPPKGIPVTSNWTAEDAGLIEIGSVSGYKLVWN